MHQHSPALADALVRERQQYRRHNADLIHHLSDHHAEHPLRRSVAALLVRLARRIEPGVAAPAAPRLAS